MEKGPCSAQSHLCGRDVDDKFCPIRGHDPSTPHFKMKKKICRTVGVQQDRR